ncbi:MAG: ABC transporter permease, partial [Planctomycetota bacterium JB042]
RGGGAGVAPLAGLAGRLAPGDGLMALVPVSYNLRSLFVRRSATLLTVLGIGATVAVVASVLALKQGFERLFVERGREDVVVVLRKGATDEGSSGIPLAQAQTLIKSSPEIAEDADGRPLAAMESYLGVRRFKVGGGETNVPVRGVQPASFRVHGDSLRVVEGRRFEPGADEVIVGAKLVGRIRNCAVGEVIVFNTTPFRVVGVFADDGPYASEIWGDVDRIGEALERPVYNRVLCRLREGIGADEFAARLGEDVRTPALAMTERAYLASLTGAISVALSALGTVLALIMGVAAVFTATNTMLAAIAARTHEIGVLLSIGFRPTAIFVSFLMEAALLGLLGGVVGCLLAIPLNGLETGTTNYQTFTEVAFAFRVSPEVLGTAVVFSLGLGLLGGAWPAWRASRMTPTRALRRG